MGLQVEGRIWRQKAVKGCCKGVCTKERYRF
jgi:hypothetical protein